MKAIVDTKMEFMGQRILLEVEVTEQGQVPDLIRRKLDMLGVWLRTGTPDWVQRQS